MSLVADPAGALFFYAKAQRLDLLPELGHRLVVL